MRTVIINGTVVTADQTIEADVLIEDGKVLAIGAAGSHNWVEGASEVIDAVGKYVVPGGVDVHTHFELPFGGTYVSDNFETGTRAAAFGGTTTVVDFAVQVKGKAVRDGFETWMQKADGNCAIDYGFHMIVGDINDSSLKEMTPSSRTASPASSSSWHIPASSIPTTARSSALCNKPQVTAQRS